MLGGGLRSGTVFTCVRLLPRRHCAQRPIWKYFSSPLRTGSVRERTIALSWGTSWREIHAFHTLVRISPSFFSLTKTHPFSHCTVRIDSTRMMGCTTNASYSGERSEKTFGKSRVTCVNQTSVASVLTVDSPTFPSGFINLSHLTRSSLRH